MFQLTAEEHEALRRQIGTSKEGRGGRRYLPYVFTQEGVAMLSIVLQSPRAVAVNIAIMRAFIRLRRWCFRSMNWPARSIRWRRSTMANSRSFSMRSANS